MTSGPLGFAQAIDEAIRKAASLEEAAKHLEWLLNAGLSVFGGDALIFIRQRVATINGLRIDIRPREHAPPHFHVLADGLDASFAIDDCRHLAGEIDGKDRALVEWWYRRSRSLLVSTWNSTRPSDCPVGPIATGPA